MNTLAQTLRRKLGPSKQGGTLSFGKRGGLNLGFETVRADDPYEWHGRRRGVGARRPQIIFQYTLEGWGLFHNGTSWGQVPQEHAFCARFPSRHTYMKDAECPAWTFLWFIVSQPYVVERLLEQSNLVNAIIPLAENSAAAQSAAELLRHVIEKDDAAHAEELLFRWMFGMESAAFSLRHPAKERREILEFVRREVIDRIDGFIAVDDLAEKWGSSRSNFSHHFSKVAGTTPASYIKEIRLGEAAQLLRNERLSVKEVAARTGFAGANHLCKVFRAQYHISPGVYQRLQAGN